MTKTLRFLAGLAAGLVLGSGVAAIAARNSSGTYSLPSGNPVVSGTTITSTWANTTLSDIRTELTDSLSRSGKGGMTAPLRGAAGSVSAPAYSWTADTDTGLYWSAANTPAMACGGVAVQSWNTTSTTVGLDFNVGGATALAGTLSVAASSTFTGAATFNGGLATTNVGAVAVASSGSATVKSGATCVCSNQDDETHPVSCKVSGTSLTITAPSSTTDVISYICF